jgi:hypothetical protein
VTRWLFLSFGLVIAALAFYALAGSGTGEPPLDDIDASSRARLENVLERTDQP